MKKRTIEELRKELRKLKHKEYNRRAYAKVKADPEKYAKVIERNRAYYFKKKAEKQEFLAAANKAVEFYNATAEDANPINLSDSIEEISMPNVDITPEPTLEEAYNNFRAKINKYFVDVTAEYSILNAFELYINAYKKYILSKVEEKVKELLNTEIGE